MDIDLWDKETQVIADDLKAIKKYQLDSQHQQRLALVNLKINILQLQGSLSSILERLVHASKRKNMLPVKQKSLLHWANIYAGKAHRYYYLNIQQLGKRMWLQLLRSRIPGAHFNPNSQFSDEQLIEMSIRHKHLQETEGLLQNHLVDLAKQRDELTHRYNDFAAIEANKEAASKMQSDYGRNPIEAFKNPNIVRVKNALNFLLKRNHSSPDKYQYMAEMHKSIDQDTNKVVSNCRKLVLDSLSYPKSRQKSYSRELEDNIRKIEALEKQLDESSALIQQHPGAARPRLISK